MSAVDSGIRRADCVSKTQEATRARGGDAAVDVCLAAAFGRTAPGSFDDAHCHVGFMADPEAFVCDAARAGSRILSVTTTPQEHARLAMRLKKASRGAAERWFADPAAVSARQGGGTAVGGGIDPAERVGGTGVLRQALGLHPWWVPQDNAALDGLLAGFDAQLSSTHFVGEVGLDFSARRASTREGQLRAFEHIARACAQTGGMVLSIHCVRAYDDALDLLERTGCVVSCACVFHWFSGTSDQLQRAIRLGCWFSVGERMLGTKRGRAYARAMPQDRLLLETDEPYVADPLSAPPAVACAYDGVAASLARAAGLLAAARGVEGDELASALRANGDALFG